MSIGTCRIVLSQLEGSGRGSLGAYNAGSWQDLHDHLHNVPMKDGEKWLAELCAKNEMLGELRPKTAQACSCLYVQCWHWKQGYHPVDELPALPDRAHDMLCRREAHGGQSSILRRRL